MAADRLDDATRDAVVTALLSEHPEARVAAIGDDGLFVPMPASMPLVRHQVLEARSALDLVVPADRVVIITTWERARAVGSALTPVRLAGGSATAVVHFVDARHSHGVYLGVLVAEAEEHASAAASVAAKIPPRLCRVSKDELAMITAVDGSTSKILGWAPEEMVGRRTLEFIHPDDHNRAIESWVEMLAAPVAEHRWRGRHQHRDGSWVWMEITNRHRLDDPEHGDVLAEMVDISDEMAAQEALRAREQLLHTLAEALPVGVFQVDGARNVVYSNNRLHEILGTDPATTCDAQLSTVVADDRRRLDDALETVLGTGIGDDVDVELRHPCTGQSRRCSMTLRALTSDEGEVNGAIVCVVDVTEAAHLRAELERRATFDGLTGCHNRSSAMATLETVLGAQGGDSRTAVVFVDVDGFKAVNDTLGHGAGDELLAIMASRLRGAVRANDVVGRIGGDEFLVISPRVESAREARRLGERLASVLHEDAVLSNATITPRASIGIAWSEVPAGSSAAAAAETIVAEADAAMYESKRRGRGDAVLFHAHASRAS